MRPDLVIFDCDGVLVDSEPPSMEVLTDDLRARGLPLDVAEAELLFTGGTMASAGAEARRRGADIPEGWTDTIYAKLYARLAQGVPVIPGVIDLLDKLDAAGIPYCVGSNGAEEKMQITLTPSGLWDRMQGKLFSAHTYGTAKPAPDLYLIAARGQGVPPARTTVIDDSPSGVRAAQAAGMRCLGFAARTDPARLVAHGAIPVTTMAEAATQLGL